MIDKLLDTDPYEIYLEDLSQVAVTIFCKNFPPHMNKDPGIGKIISSFLPQFLDEVFSKSVQVPTFFMGSLRPASLLMFSSLSLKNLIPKIVETNCISFEAQFKPLKHPTLSGVFSEENNRVKRSEGFHTDFLLLCYYLMKNFPNLTQFDKTEFVRQGHELEQQFIPIYGKVIETMNEYVVYFDYPTHCFSFELKD